MGTVSPHTDRQPRTHFGFWLRDHRLSSGLSVSQLAAQVAAITGRDCNIGRISEWMQGMKLPRPDQLRALEQIFDSAAPQPELAPRS